MLKRSRVPFACFFLIFHSTLQVSSLHFQCESKNIHTSERKAKAKGRLPKTPSEEMITIRKTHRHGGGLLATLRRIVRRKKANSKHSSASPNKPSAKKPNAGAATQSRRLHPMMALRSGPAKAADEPSTVNKGDHAVDEVDDEDEEDEEDNEEDNEEENQPTDTSKDKNQKRTSKRSTKTSKSKWVKQLLNQVDEKRKDRVYTAKRKQKHALALQGDGGGSAKAPSPPNRLFTVVNALNSYLMAKILLFLDVKQPAAVCAYVNKAFAAEVTIFYELYCPHPRPQRFLAKKLFNSKTRSCFPEKILSWLSITERVRVSSCCKALYSAASSLELEISGSRKAAQFLHCMTEERVEARFAATSVLRLGTERMKPRSATALSMHILWNES